MNTRISVNKHGFTIGSRFEYIPHVYDSRTRNGGSRLQRPSNSFPRKSINKVKNLENAKMYQKNGNKFNSNVSINSHKYAQRLRFLYYLTSILSSNLSGSSVIIVLDSEIFHVYHMILEKLDNLNASFNASIRIVCINGGHDKIKLPTKSEKYNIEAICSDMGEFTNSLPSGTKISLMWNDTMSGYCVEYRNKFSSTKKLFEIMCQKNLIDNTIVMWNADFGRKNRKKYNYDENLQFELAAKDFTSLGYEVENTLTSGYDIEPLSIYITNDGSTSRYAYIDKMDGKNIEYIYHEFTVRVAKKIIIELD